MKNMSKLKKCRLAALISTQAELAEMVGLDKRDISGYETLARDLNKTQYGTVKRIADALNVSCEDIVEDE